MVQVSLAALPDRGLTHFMTTIMGEMPEFDLLAPISSDTDVIDRVDQLIDPGERRDRSLWLFFLTADAIQLPVVVPIDDMPASPDPGTADGICHVIAGVLDDEAPGGSAVVTLVRASGLGVTDADRQWLLALRSAADKAGAELRMLCLATRQGTRRLDL